MDCSKIINTVTNVHYRSSINLLGRYDLKHNFIYSDCLVLCFLINWIFIIRANNGENAMLLLKQLNKGVVAPHGNSAAFRLNFQLVFACFDIEAPAFFSTKNLSHKNHNNYLIRTTRAKLFCIRIKQRHKSGNLGLH